MPLLCKSAHFKIFSVYIVRCKQFFSQLIADLSLSIVFLAFILIMLVYLLCPFFSTSCGFKIIYESRTCIAISDRVFLSLVVPSISNNFLSLCHCWKFTAIRSLTNTHFAAGNIRYTSRNGEIQKKMQTTTPAKRKMIHNIQQTNYKIWTNDNNNNNKKPPKCTQRAHWCTLSKWERNDTKWNKKRGEENLQEVTERHILFRRMANKKRSGAYID